MIGPDAGCVDRLEGPELIDVETAYQGLPEGLVMITKIPVVDQRQHDVVKAIRILHQRYSVSATNTRTRGSETLLRCARKSGSVEA